MCAVKLVHTQCIIDKLSLVRGLGHAEDLLGHRQALFMRATFWKQDEQFV